MAIQFSEDCYDKFNASKKLFNASEWLSNLVRTATLSVAAIVPDLYESEWLSNLVRTATEICHKIKFVKKSEWLSNLVRTATEIPSLYTKYHFRQSGYPI